jgi:membrane protein
MKRAREIFANLVNLLTETYEEWRDDRVVRLGAALAYYALFAIVPFIAISVAVAGLIFSTEEVQSFLMERLDGFVQGDVEALAADLTETLKGSVRGMGVLGAVTLLFAASVLVGALQDVLNVIWHRPVRAGFTNTIRERALAFSVVLLTVAVVIAGLLVETLLGLAEALVPGNVAVLDSFAGLITSLSSWALGGLAVALVFRLLPYAEVPWRHAFIGGFVAAVLMVVGSSLFGWYLSRYGTSSASGVAGAVALFLVWVYYLAQILLTSSELTKVLGMRSNGSASQPAKS